MAESDSLDFATLDALLDTALELDEHALAAFLEELPEAQREALVRLLDAAGSDVLARADAAVRETLGKSGADGPSTPLQAEGSAGPWRLRREIGSGGTGQVFYAERIENASDENTVFEQQAAVKILWSHRIGSQYSERFFRERRILASIDHPGLARFLDGGLLGDNRPWFAMEYVEGDDIVTACSERSLDECLRLLLDVCDTIDYAHQRLIVHRDIKPGNVLVDAAGRPRVLDFGIARILGDTGEQALTRAGGTPLTLQYASPEQVTGSGVDVASDIYQLGVLGYEMLTGKKPYAISEASLRDAVRTISETEPPPASQHGRGIDRDLDAILAQALAKQPAARYPSAAALADDLRRYLDDRPVLARPQTAWYVAGRFLRRQALLVGVISVSVLGLAAATVFSIDQAREARIEAERTRATQEILADVFQQADPFGEGGAEITLAEALIRARPAIEKKVADDPRLAYEVHKTLAQIFTSLDMPDYETEAFEAAWAAAKALGRGYEAQALSAIAGIGNVMARTDPADAAAFLAENVPEEPASEPAAVDWLTAKYAEANAWLRLRDYERSDAIAMEMDAVATRYRVDEPRTLGRISQFLAGAARRAGDVPAADAHWQAAVEYMRLAGQPAGHAVFLSNMALHYGMTGRYPESKNAFEEAIAVFREHDPENSSFANILRLYAGLQFRMGEAEAALATLDESRQLLDPDREPYAYLVAQDSAATFAFASENFPAAFNAIDDGLAVSIAAFGADDDVTARMRPVFARLLLFAGRDRQAARVLRVTETDCDNEIALADAIDAALTSQSPAVSGRDELDAALATAANARDVDPETINGLATRLRQTTDVFLDPLDHWRFLNAVNALAGEYAIALPPDMQQRLDGLQQSRAELQAFLDGQAGGRVEERLAALDADPVPAVCD